MTHHPSQTVESGRTTPTYDDINTSLILMVGIASAIITYLSVVVVQGLTYQMDMNMIRQRSHGAQYTKSVDTIVKQQESLQANPEIKRLSIEQAMSETVAKYAAGSSGADGAADSDDSPLP